MSIQLENICFGTLAYGLQFRIHAKILAQDFLLWHPGTRFFVVTDHPEYFQSLPNVIAVKYKPSGIRSCYHDKRQVLKEALNHYAICIYLDADCRIVEPIPFDDLIHDQVFFTAIYGENLETKLSIEIRKGDKAGRFNGPHRRKRILSAAAAGEGVNFNQVTFINETFFVVNSQHGDAQEFLTSWDFCARYTTARLFEFGEGASIGIALEKANEKHFLLNKCPSWLFKDGFSDIKTKTESQLERFCRLVALRRAIEADDWPRENRLNRLVSTLFRAIRFYVNYLYYK